MAWKAYNTINGQIMGEVSDAPGANATDYLTDALGSVVATVSGGKILNTYRWSGYGQQVLKTGIGPDPKFLWVGGWGYRSSGLLLYVRERALSTSLSVWLSIDDLWPHERKYSYSAQNPASRIDPTGLTAEQAAINRYCSGPGVECCEPLPPGADPNMPYFCKRRRGCEKCIKAEKFRSVEAYCSELSRFSARRPAWPGIGDLLCARNALRTCIDNAYKSCPGPGHSLFDKCRHCMASCCIANKCGAKAAEWLGWCRERQQLADCVAGGYGTDDHDANLIGIGGRPKCRNACRRYGAK